MRVEKDMPERKIAVLLTESQIQEVTQVVLDHDGEAALNLLERVVHPQVEAALTKGHCRPAFEIERGTDLSAIRPPSTDKG